MRIIRGKVHTTTKDTEFGSVRGDEKRKRRAAMVEKIKARQEAEGINGVSEHRARANLVLAA